MNNKIPTAEEFLQNSDKSTFNSIEQTLIEFAKLHIKSALEAAADNAKVQFNSDNFRFTFENAYPLINIK